MPQHYPKLSTIVNASAIPGDLKAIEQLIQGGINALLGELRYTNYIVEHSPDGDTAFYSLVLLGKELDLPLFGTGMHLVFFKGETLGYSNFPITMDWRWPIQRYFSGFEREGFSYAPEAFLEILLEMADIDSEQEVIEEIINVFLSDGTSPYTDILDEVEDSFERLRDNWNSNANVKAKLQSILDEVKIITARIKARKQNGDSLIDIAKTFNDDTIIQGAIDNITNTFKDLESSADVDVDIYKIFINAVLADISDIDEKFDRLFELFSNWLGNITKEDIEYLLIPQFGIELHEISMALELPRKWVIPMKKISQPRNTFIWIPTEPGPIDSSLPRAAIEFTAGAVKYHTLEGFEIDILDGPDAARIDLPRCMIPKIELQLELIKIKLDLSRQKNIAEAIADDRPEDFIGVYVQEANIFLPSKWFKFDPDGSTLKIFAQDLLIGTGGISGIMGIEAVSGLIPPLEDQTKLKDGRSFSINVTGGDDNAIIDIGDIVTIDGNTAEKGRYVLQYGGSIFVNKDGELEKFAPSDGALSYEFGKEGEWEIGFNQFYLKLVQNKVIESEITGFIKIPNFKQFNPETETFIKEDLKVNIELSFENDGDFQISASPEDGLCLGIEDVFYIKVNSLAVGKEEAKSYIEVSGSIHFDINNLLKKYLKEPIEIKKLRIYADGSMEIEGGSIPISDPKPMKLGPVEVNITNITMGAEDINPSYKFIGFDCGISTGPGGVDARGDGIQLFFGKKNGKLDMFLRIAGIGVDIIIPGTATEETAALILKGYLSMKEAEYTGSVAFKLPKVKIAGGAAMKMKPKVPAFAVDAFMEMSTAIPLGPTGLGIYAFRGLFGLRYVADFPEGATSDPKKLFDFYTDKKLNPLSNSDQKGLHLGKIVTPEDRTDSFKASGTPISIGAGLSLGTAMDSGRTFSMMAFLFLSIPELLMVSGKANILSERVSIVAEDEPPFFAYLALTKEFISLGLGADYTLRKGTGEFLELQVEAQLAFFFRDPSAWYVHLGTKDEPIRARLLKKIFDLNAYAYLMLSASGIEAGAGVKFYFAKKYGPASIEAKAYVDVYGMISFRKPQVGGGVALGGSIDVRAFGISLFFSLDAYLMMTVPRPFIVRGGVEVCVSIKLVFIKFEKCFNVSFKWEFKKDNDVTPIGAIAEEYSPASGYHIGSGIPYQLSDYTNSLSTIDINNLKKVPMDTYIDIQFKKAMYPNGATNIGGVTTASTTHWEKVSPKSVDGQVKHHFKVTEVQIKAWDGSNWKDYHPYEALATNTIDPGIVAQDLKIGYWQIKGKEYNDLRILANNPFSYFDSMSGEIIPEKMGITAATLFCEDEKLEKHCITWEEIKIFKSNTWTAHKNVLFRVTKKDGTVADFTNPFQIPRSLKFDNHSKVEIIFPEAVSECHIRLSSFVRAIDIQYYSWGSMGDMILNEEGEEIGRQVTAPKYELIEEIAITKNKFNDPIVYNNQVKPVKKIVISVPCADEKRINAIKNRLLQLEQRLLEGINYDENDHPIKDQLRELKGTIKKLESNCCPDNGIKDRIRLIKQQITRLEKTLTKLKTKLPSLKDKADTACKQYKGWNNFYKQCLAIELNCEAAKKKSFIPKLDSKIDQEEFLSSIKAIQQIQNKLKQCCDQQKKELATLHKKLKGDIAKYKKECTKGPKDIEKLRDKLIKVKEKLKTVQPIVLPGKRPTRPIPTSINKSIKSRRVTKTTKTRREVAVFNKEIAKLEKEIKTRTTSTKNACLKYEKLSSFFETIQTIKFDCKNLIGSNPIAMIGNVKRDELFIPYINVIIKMREKMLKCCQSIEGKWRTILGRINSAVNKSKGKCEKFKTELATVTKQIEGIKKQLEGLKNILEELGEDSDTCSSYLHEICYLTEEEVAYNLSIPAQSVIDDDFDKMQQAINNVIAPIWKPDTVFAIQVNTKETVNVGATHNKTYFFPFATGGPIGHFPLASLPEEIKTQNYLDVNGDPLTIHPVTKEQIGIDFEKGVDIPETALKFYLHNERCYPDPTGNIIGSKPMYYKKPEVLLFFIHPYVKHFFSNWPDYQGLGTKSAALEIVIKDPVDNFREDTSKYEVLPVVEKPITTARWEKDDDHNMIPKPLEILNDLRDPTRKNVTFNETTCWQLGGAPLKPRSDRPVILIDRSLLPSKLYNVVVFNEYEGAKAQIHSYAFQTSRYSNLTEHIGSYQQVSTYEEEDGSRKNRNAIFEIINTEMKLSEMHKIASETNGSVHPKLLETYSDLYQRLIDGYLVLKDIEPPVCAEFNFLKNGSGATIAIWIRTPEPINDPRLPDTELANTIELDGWGRTGYQVVHSSDRSCAMIVLDSSLPTSITDLKIKFFYKNWNGVEYSPVDDYTTENLI